MADSEFKKHPITFAEGWVPHSNGGEIGKDKYKPDRSFKDAQGRVVCVVESSSTNDRKVGVGELCLADKFFFDARTSGVLIFSLCGRSSTRPTPDSQIQYLRPIFTHLRSTNRAHGVMRVYAVEERDFAALGWKAMTPEFLGKARELKA